MIRTQIYIDENLHKDLFSLAKIKKEPMAKVARDILKEGVKMRKNLDKTGKKVLLAIANMNLKTSKDKNLSSSIDYYLYGGKKRE